MKNMIAKLISGLTNFKTLTVVMFIIFSILITNNMIPNDETIFYIVIYTIFILCYVYDLIGKFYDKYYKIQ